MRFASYVLNNQQVFIPELLNQPSYSLNFAPIGMFNSIPTQPQNPDFHPNVQLMKFLYGRHLLIDEIPYSFLELHEHYLNGYLHFEPGIQSIDGKATCMRCGSTDSFSFFACSRCHSKNCRYCRKCIRMGKVTFCSPLYSISKWIPKNEDKAVLEWSGTLSDGQKEASNAVVMAIQHNLTLLVWAVCGSGKTEVLFNGLAHALTNQKSVCIATPRTDVVLELAPRLQKVFPSLVISPLYAGHSDPHSHFVVSTTHQMIRFKNYFDVMIIDEVDAFPYSVDSSLQYNVEKARKQGGSLIYLTATPSPLILKKENLQIVRIPSRYHGFPLPIPTCHWSGNWRKKINKGHLPHILIEWIKKQVSERKPVLLFLPSIKIINQTKDIFEKNHFRCESVHSEDENRAEKVLRFRNKEIPILLSSTILERGITIENISVAVLGAEDEVFTESALVQIAGRAGRSKRFPEGDVRFFHYGKTNAMLEAIKHIKKMNVEAREKGWLN
ncbi:DEAD/DEAH box helicase [Guptibacillus hwajinpoensis]|uniref:DEAD/DEAH box helicase n=1 Tax=Guptibacillus hwajinpoensis TaxID=208199 RepID=UPI0024B35D78|nr:DEAD/DEAH box helicase [Pseudalkalibacillus hwajinpoensis]